MGVTEWVMNEISPISKWVPILISTETPIAAKKSTGSNQDRVDKINRSKISGMAMSMAFMTSPLVACCIATASTASPASAPCSPISARIEAQAEAWLSCSRVSENSAAPSR